MRVEVRLIEEVELAIYGSKVPASDGSLFRSRRRGYQGGAEAAAGEMDLLTLD